MNTISIQPLSGNARHEAVFRAWAAICRVSVRSLSEHEKEACKDCCGYEHEPPELPPGHRQVRFDALDGDDYSRGAPQGCGDAVECGSVHINHICVSPDTGRIRILPKYNRIIPDGGACGDSEFVHIVLCLILLIFGI